MELHAFVIICLFGASTAFLIPRPSNWDDLEVTWGANPFNKDYFASLPRTASDAENKGWLEVSKCNESAEAKVRGRLYVQNDYSVVLIFDKNGYIAGMQTQVPGNKEYNYPAKGLVPPFVQYGFNYYMTVYFTDPTTICSTGRTQKQFEKEGTGTDLYIQTGPHPDTDLMKIPNQEKDLEGTNWVEGKCFYTMGKHYWYNITEDQSCDKMFPVFLLYNNNKLNAFGFVLTVSLGGHRYEHPGNSVYKLFMKSVPKCLATRGEISTMHVYLTSKPKLDFC